MFNPEDFRARKKDIIKYFSRKGVDSERIAEYASLTGTPLTVIYTFIKEDFPEKKTFCEERIAELEKYYGL